MRLDLFLKVSRLLPRRSLAQEFCNAGLVRVNGQEARPSKAIKAGDQIEMKRRGRIFTFRTVEIPKTKQLSKEKAAELIELVSDIEDTDKLI